MPQNEHIELAQKRFGRRLDHDERKRKKEARSVKKIAKTARSVRETINATAYNHMFVF